MKALALFSGGLDSVLSILAIKKQGIEVVGLTFLSSFGCKSKLDIELKNKKIAEKFDFEMIVDDFTIEQFDIIKNPKFGHGKNLNPCLDCHILMLKKAKKIMQEIDADFIITGEVIGQRPKSQRRDTFPVIDRESGLEGLVVRPLSAKNMPITIPEKNLWIDREKLYGIGGRGRKKQIEMAKKEDWEDFPAPAGGCLLTDIGYSNRLKNFIIGDIIPSEKEIALIPIGRHFIINDKIIVVGRRMEENGIIEDSAEDNDILIQIQNHGSPITIIKNITNYTDKEEIIEKSAKICGRYSDGKLEKTLKAKVWGKDYSEKIIEISPFQDEEIQTWIVK